MPTAADTRNVRQGRTYTYKVNLYQPSTHAVGAKNQALDQEWPTTPTWSGVWCYWNNKDESDTPSTVGRTNYDIIITTDTFKFCYEQAIDDGWLIEMIDGAGPEDGSTFIAMGGAQQRANKFARRAHQQTVAARRCPRPAYFPAFEGV